MNMKKGRNPKVEKVIEEGWVIFVICYSRITKSVYSAICQLENKLA
jgi:hypothetical protein